MPPKGATELPHLSPEELRLLGDTHFLLSKHRIQKELEKLLAIAEREMRQQLSQSGVSLSATVASKTGKISRGENYQLLPYLVLDYPRHFSKTSVFACRTMCWWGHDFSCTLLLQGELLEHYRTALLRQAERLTSSDCWIGIHQSPWEHHFETDNIREARNFSTAELQTHLQQHPFVKITRRLPLAAYEQLPAFAAETFGMFLALISP